MTNRRLILMRHAKAEPFAATDHDRPLTERGTREAEAAGRYLAQATLVPDHAVVSSAVRAVDTWTAVAESAGVSIEPDVDAAVFTGSPDVVLDALRRVPEEAETVLFVGHNPTTAYVAHLLDDGEGEPEATARLLAGFPTGAMAVFEVDGAWSELREESGRLVGFHVGQDSAGRENG